VRERVLRMRATMRASCVVLRESRACVKQQTSQRYLIHHRQALKTVAYEILSCQNDQAILSVGELHYDHFIRACTFTLMFMFFVPSIVQSHPTKEEPH
jgi:hypothetical protein